MGDIKEGVVQILKDNVEELEGVEITDDLQMISSGYIDSFDIINVISLLEEKFGISIDLANLKLGSFDTVESICKIIAASPAK